jgi:hypothetical protein
MLSLVPPAPPVIAGAALAFWLRRPRWLARADAGHESALGSRSLTPP